MVIAISGKQVIDGTGRDPIPGGIVLVDGDRIVAVGRSDAVHIPADATKIDLPGETILPGMIDAHSHVVLRESRTGATPAEQQLQRDSTLALRGARNLREDLRAGVTTVRTMSDRNFVDVAVRRAIEEGETAGPRMVVATRGIRTTHGWGSSGVAVDGVEEVRKAVRENLQYGADLTKLFLTSKAGPDPAKFQYGAFQLEPTLSRDEIEVAVDETHRAGKPVAAHALGGDGFRWAIEAGVDTIEHGGYVTQDDLDLVVKHGTWLVFTLTVLLDTSYLEALTAWQDAGYRERALAYQEALRTYVRTAIEADAKYTIGADGRHGRLALEMEYLVSLGVSPFEAIRAGTSRAAEAIRVADRVGTLEPGKLADVISVIGDPLQDITAMANVNLILKGGDRADSLSTT